MCRNPIGGPGIAASVGIPDVIVACSLEFEPGQPRGTQNLVRRALHVVAIEVDSVASPARTHIV